MSNAGYRIPAPGSIAHLTGVQKLFPLLRDRLESAAVVEDPATGGSGEEPAEEETSPTSGGRGSSDLRERTRDRNLSPEEVENQIVEAQQSVKDQIQSSMEHEESLDVFEDYLINQGFDTGETKHSDILGTNELHVVIGEAKSIHGRNVPTQIRHGLGQLLEYTYFDVRKDESRSKKELTRCLVLTREPPAEYREFLQDLQDEGIYTYWTDEFAVKGLSKSMERLESVTN